MKCGHCGSEVLEGSKFCPECGNKIEVPNNQGQDKIANPQISQIQQTSPTPNKQKRKLGFPIIVGLSIAGIVIIVIFFLIIGLAIIAMYPQTNSNRVQSGNSQTSTNTGMQAALSDYNAKITIANMAASTLSNYAKNQRQFVDLNDYKSWIDGYKQALDIYQLKVNDEITAGEVYKQYLTAGSSEYNNIVNNELIANNNIQTDITYYNQLIADYNKKKAQQDAYNVYMDKIRIVESTEQDMQDYANTSTIFSAIDSSWISGFGVKVNAFTTACDNAILAGQQYQQYLDPSSTQYQQVSAYDSQIASASSEVKSNYNDMQQSSSDLGSLLSIIKYLPLLGL